MKFPIGLVGLHILTLEVKSERIFFAHTLAQPQHFSEAVSPVRPHRLVEGP